jgi:putative endonuclease
MKRGFVYIETNFAKTVFYTGVTSNIEDRHNKHVHKEYEGFSSKYHTKYLVWLDEFATMSDAIDFEKKIKRWKRLWKIELIEKQNPQ